MKKELPKQEPKSKPLWILALYLVLIFLAAGEYVLLQASRETNRLLSTFQRIDTVKDEAIHLICGDNGFINAEIFMKANELAVLEGRSVHIPENCTVATTAIIQNDKNSKILEKLKSDPQSDPNLCYHWDSDCKSSAGGWSECTTVCHMQPEPK